MIWIDITNLPHVLFFERFIKNGRAFVTSREFGSLAELLRGRGIEHTAVGKHGGREPREKLVQSARRVLELARILPEEVEVGVAKQSAELPRVAFGLGLPCIQVVDNEYAEHQNRLTLPLCTRVLVPEALEVRRLLRQGAEKGSITRFKGLCELSHIKNFKPGGRLMEEEYVLVRPMPRLAAYFRGKEFTQEVIDSLSRSCKVLVLPRGGERYRNAAVPETADSLSLIYHAAAFIGGGGTMNRESALLGTPTVSYYPQELLGVDRFLIKKRLMGHASSPEEVMHIMEGMVERKDDLRRKAGRLRESMEDPLRALGREVSSLGALP